MEVREMILDEDKLEMGVEAISIVERPAIESDFVALNETAQVKLATVDEERRIIMGPILIPDKKIYREENGKEYYIYFSKDTVRKISELYQRKGLQSKSTLEHAVSIEGVTLVETWIKEDAEKDKSQLYKLDAPVGTWLGSMKVYNNQVWDEYVKTGKVKGFSIEGFFKEKVEASEQVSLSEVLAENIEGYTSELISLMKIGKEPQYYSGIPEEAKKVISTQLKKSECGAVVSQVVLAQQLVNDEGVSIDTIKAMRRFLSLSQGKKLSHTEQLAANLYGGEAAFKWCDSIIQKHEKQEGNA